MIRRWIFRLITMLVVLPIVGTTALWVRSRTHMDLFGCEGNQSPTYWQRGGYAFSGNGAVGAEWWLRENSQYFNQPLRTGRGWEFSTWSFDPSNVTSNDWHGFMYQVDSFDAAPVASDGRPMPKLMTYIHRVAVPHWFILLILMAMASLLLCRELRQRWRRRCGQLMLCVACGYDSAPRRIDVPNAGKLWRQPDD